MKEEELKSMLDTLVQKLEDSLHNKLSNVSSGDLFSGLLTNYVSQIREICQKK